MRVFPFLLFLLLSSSALQGQQSARTERALEELYEKTYEEITVPAIRLQEDLRHLEPDLCEVVVAGVLAAGKDILSSPSPRPSCAILFSDPEDACSFNIICVDD